MCFNACVLCYVYIFMYVYKNMQLKKKFKEEIENISDKYIVIPMKGNQP